MDLGYAGGLTATYDVSDMDRAIAWYVDVLGFTLEYRLDEMGWCELRSPVNRVWVGLSQVESVQPKGGAVLVWGVNDIDKSRQMLEGAGVTFDGPTREIPGMVKLATFFDPDGHALMLYQSLSEQVPG